MNLQNIAYQTILDYTDTTYQSNTIAAATIQRWFAIVQFIHSNRHPTIALFTTRKCAGFLTEWIEMVTINLTDCAAKLDDYVVRTDRAISFRNMNQLHRYIIGRTIGAKSLSILSICTDKEDATSLIPHQWIVLSV